MVLYKQLTNKSALARKFKNTILDVASKGMASTAIDNVVTAARRAVDRRRQRNKAKAQDKLVQAAFAMPRIPPRQQKSLTFSQSVRLKKCSIKYLLAAVDPFNPMCSGACNPAMVAAQSQKIRAQGSFAVTVGTSGIGWALLYAPLGKDNVLAIKTDATYAGTIASPFSANNTLNTGVSVVYPTNLPYSVSDLSGPTSDQVNAQLAPVSYGFRSRYTGTTLNEGGMQFCYTDPNHVSTSGMSQTDIVGRTECEITGVSRTPCTLVLNCISDLEGSGVHAPSSLRNFYPFSDTQQHAVTYGSSTAYTYVDNGGITIGVPVGIMLFSGTAGNTFYIEYDINLNGKGPKCSQNYTPHETDIEGATQIMSAIMAVPSLRASFPNLSGWQIARNELARIQESQRGHSLPKSPAGITRI